MLQEQHLNVTLDPRSSRDIVQVLAALHAQAPFAELVSHEETGNAFTYERDLHVGAELAGRHQQRQREQVSADDEGGLLGVRLFMHLFVWNRAPSPVRSNR